MRHKKQATRLLCQLSPSSEDRERERAERSQREGREQTERRQREGKERQRYARGKEATNQREREPQKSFRCERRNARFALVDATPKRLPQLNKLPAPRPPVASRQISSPCSPLFLSLYSLLLPLWSCVVGVRN